MPVPQKLREANQTTVGNLICYFYAILIPVVILIVLITTGITIRIAITVTM
jgi:uncharacterized membrane protein YgaE (UPF0421/DUF939 family)